MNTYTNSWDEQSNREPILEIWRKLKKREEMEESVSAPQDESPEDTLHDESMN